jgi:cytochrome b subunit of formate dehydrogenase
MRDTLITINSFIHDMATGVWLAVLLVMYIISGRSGEITSIPQGQAFVSGLMANLWTASLVSLAVIAVTGIIRGLTFKYYGWTGDVAKGRKHLLMIKHIILGVVFALGLYLQYVLAASG